MVWPELSSTAIRTPYNASGCAVCPAWSDKGTGLLHTTCSVFVGYLNANTNARRKSSSRFMATDGSMYVRDIQEQQKMQKRSQ
jgi:hypothetical protein